MKSVYLWLTALPLVLVACSDVEFNDESSGDANNKGNIGNKCVALKTDENGNYTFSYSAKGDLKRDEQIPQIYPPRFGSTYDGEGQIPECETTKDCPARPALAPAFLFTRQMSGHDISKAMAKFENGELYSSGNIRLSEVLVKANQVSPNQSELCIEKILFQKTRLTWTSQYSGGSGKNERLIVPGSGHGQLSGKVVLVTRNHGLIVLDDRDVEVSCIDADSNGMFSFGYYLDGQMELTRTANGGEPVDNLDNFAPSDTIYARLEGKGRAYKFPDCRISPCPLAGIPSIAFPYNFHRRNGRHKVVYSTLSVTSGPNRGGGRIAISADKANSIANNSEPINRLCIETIEMNVSLTGDLDDNKYIWDGELSGKVLVKTTQGDIELND